MTSQALSAAAATTGVPAGSPTTTGRLRGQLAEPSAGRHELGQPGRVDRRRLPAPVARLRPAERLRVERDVADLRRQRIDEPAGQPVGEIAGEQQVAPDPRPRRRLVGPEPVGLAVGLERGDGPPDAEGPEREPGDAADLRHALGAPLVQPDDRRPERDARGIGDDDRRPLGRERDAGDGVRTGDAAGPQRGARLADRPPVQVRILLGPARLRGDVRLDRDLRRRDERPARVEHERPDALRPDVDREQVVGRHGRRTPGLRMRSGSSRAAIPARSVQPELALLGREPRPVVAPDAVLVADRPAVSNDRPRSPPSSGRASGRASRPGPPRSGRRTSRTGSTRSGRRATGG